MQIPCVFICIIPHFWTISSPLLYQISTTISPHFYQYSPSHWKWGILIKKGDIQDGGFWILKWRILNVHPSKFVFSHWTVYRKTGVWGFGTPCQHLFLFRVNTTVNLTVESYDRGVNTINFSEGSTCDLNKFVSLWLWITLLFTNLTSRIRSRMLVHYGIYMLRVLKAK